MRKTFITIALAMVALVAVPAMAGQYQSDLGYTLELPQGWSVLNRDKIKDQPAMVDAAFAAAQKEQDLADMPATLVDRLKKMINAGEIDYFYSSEPRFNVSVYSGAGNLPTGPGKVQQTCNAIREELSKEAGRQTKVEQCRAAELDGRDGIYIVADNYWKGQKYIQVQIQKGDNKILVFTASSRERAFDEMTQEFDQVMNSVQIN